MMFILEVAFSNAIVAGVLAVAVFALTLAWRPPALVHCLWLLVLARFVMPPLVAIPIVLPRPHNDLPADANLEFSLDTAPNSEATANGHALKCRNDATALDSSAPKVSDAPQHISERKLANADASPLDSVATTSSPQSRTFRVSLVDCLIGVWIIGAVVILLRSLWQLARFQRLLKFADPADDAVRAVIEEQATAMKLHRAPEALVAPGALSPMLWAFGWRAKLLLPRQLLDELSDDALRTVIVHELAHYRRCDHWIRGLELIVTSLFWWHPLLWLAVRELRRNEEVCCDAWVVSQLPDHRGVYARTLVEAIGFLSARPSVAPAVSGVFGKGFYRSIEQRVRNIMSQSPASGIRMSVAMRLGVAVFALVALPLFPVAGDDRDTTSAPVADAGQAPKQGVQRVRPPAEEPTSFAGGGLAELGAVNDVAVSSDGRLLAAGHGLHGGPGAFSLWDLKTRQLVGSTTEDRRVMDVEFSPDGKLVGYGTMGNAVRVRRTDTLAIAQDLTGFDYTNVFVAFSPKGDLFAVSQKEIRLYDTKTWRRLPTTFDPGAVFSREDFTPQYGNPIDFSPDGAGAAFRRHVQQA